MAEDTLKKRYIIKLTGNFINGLINIALIAIVPKSLGPIAYGQFTFIQQFYTQTIAFLDASTSIAFFTKLSAQSKRKELILFYFVFSIFLLILLSLFISILDLTHSIDKVLPSIPTEYVYLGLFFGYLTWFTQVYIKISDAYALTVSIELGKIIHKVFMLLVLMFIIHYTLFDLFYYFYFHYFSLLSFLLFVTIIFIKKNIITQKLLIIKLNYRELILEFYQYVSPLFIFNFIAIAVSLFDIWLLQHMSGSIQTGYYGLAYTVAAMCLLFTSAMTPLITREFSKYSALNDKKAIKRLFKKYVPMLYSLASFFGVFIAFQSENLLLIFTDDNFKDAYIVLMIMAFFPIHQTYGQLNGSLFFAMERTRRYSKIGIMISVSGLILSFLFLFYYEFAAEGLAWKMIIMQIIGVNIQLYFNVKSLKLKLLPFIYHQIYSIAFFVSIGYLANNIIPDITSYSLGDFLFRGFIYTLLSVVGIFFFPSIFSSTQKELFAIIYSIKKRLKR